MSIHTVTTAEDFSTILINNSQSLVVVHFWAQWSEPSKAINNILQALSQNKNNNIVFVKVEAEELSTLSKSFNVTSVPSILFIRNRTEIDRIEGANPPALSQKLAEHSQQQQQQQQQAPHAEDLNTRIQKLINQAPFVLFMKGSPDAVRCGFSRKVVELLKKEDIQFAHFDILSDNAIREGVKVYSNWPSFPQFYAHGKLVGGCDILTELSQEGGILANIDT
eukprot:TRINITY_DN986_c2_g1_i1.p1 TRINITY_DN986_c2_g1~~TRINITY_DN986_c2_g1_i1.p1  ORF type:complete len:222 (+),score=48.10 TRINITY_DN986_c2_g1_i1:77-742(+)